MSWRRLRVAGWEHSALLDGFEISLRWRTLHEDWAEDVAAATRLDWLALLPMPRWETWRWRLRRCRESWAGPLGYAATTRLAGRGLPVASSSTRSAEGDQLAICSRRRGGRVWRIFVRALGLTKARLPIIYHD